MAGREGIFQEVIGEGIQRIRRYRTTGFGGVESSCMSCNVGSVSIEPKTIPIDMGQSLIAFGE